MDRKTALNHMIWQQENWQLHRPTMFRPKVLEKYKRELAKIERKEAQRSKVK